MSSASITFRFISLLCVLTVLNIFFYSIFWRRKDSSVACSIDAVIQAAARYIRDRGKFNVEHGMPEACVRAGLSEETKTALYRAVHNVISECEEKEKSTPKVFLSYPILTLFTSWDAAQDKQKDMLHNITLSNWRSFKPQINPIVFTNDTSVETVAEENGWTVLPIEDEGGGGAPVLKSMFAAAMQASNTSLLYGYTNSDILFTKDLLSTLEIVLQRFNSTSPFLAVGRRTNVNNISPEEASSEETLRQAAKSRGVLFAPNAEDYFITNKAFPWNDILDVVIGRLAYDNWLVGHTRCSLNVSVIELTDTVLAVHQTTQAGGNFEGFKHPKRHYNEEVFKKANIKPVYERGFTTCGQYRTYNSFCGIEVAMRKAEEFHSDCSCTTIPKRGKR